MKVIDQENLIRELESALDHMKLQCDRQLTLQHKEHEKKLQLILHHFKGICFLGWYCSVSIIFSHYWQILYSSRKQKFVQRYFLAVTNADVVQVAEEQAHSACMYVKHSIFLKRYQSCVFILNLEYWKV